MPNIEITQLTKREQVLAQGQDGTAGTTGVLPLRHLRKLTNQVTPQLRHWTSDSMSSDPRGTGSQSSPLCHGAGWRPGPGRVTAWVSREAQGARGAEREGRAPCRLKAGPVSTGLGGDGPGWRRATPTGERDVPAHTRINQEQAAQGAEGPAGAVSARKGPSS